MRNYKSTAELRAEIVRLLGDKSTVTRGDREKVADSILLACVEKTSMAKGSEIHKAAQSVFRATMIQAAEAGETVMEFGGDENFYQTAHSLDLLHAAASYFDETV